MNDSQSTNGDESLWFLGTSVMPELDGVTVGVYRRGESDGFVVGDRLRIDAADYVVGSGLTDDTFPYRRRPDLPTLEAGGLYFHDHGDMTVRFLGTASVFELHGETVGICQSVDESDTFVILTQRGYNQGETLTPIGDRLAEQFRVAIDNRRARMPVGKKRNGLQ